jgi:ribosome recycling factor
MSNVESQVKQAMQMAVDHLRQDLKTLRSSRANPSLLDKVYVEIFGSPMPLKALANITIPEARQIVVTPFDDSNINAISKAIENAKLGVNPRVDGKVVRINIPAMDESIRKQIAKQCKEMGEKSKIALREIRRKFNDLIRKQKADGIMPEDQMKKNEKTIQDLTDKFCKEVDGVCSEKEKEIMSI